jgi:hypothetical protein
MRPQPELRSMEGLIRAFWSAGVDGAGIIFLNKLATSDIYIYNEIKQLKTHNKSLQQTPRTSAAL